MTAKWSVIAGTLRAEILEGRLQTGDRLPSETELAAQWQVCRMTAHRAMDELHRQGLVERRRRVGTIVRGPDTEKEGKNGKDSPRTRYIALLFYSVNGYPQASYLEGFRAALPDQYHLLYCDTQKKPEREAEYLRQMAGQAEAICCYPTDSQDNLPLFQQLVESGTRLLCLDHYPEGVRADAIITDNYGSTLHALRALKLRGHRRIAFISTDRYQVSSVRERRDAFFAFLTENEVRDAASLLPLLPRVSGYSFDQYARLVCEALLGLMALPEPPTALFCLEDFFLATTLEACDQLKLRVPEDLEIVSFSDRPHFEPRIPRTVHRIVQQAEEMGRLAAQRLLRRVNGEKLEVETVRVPAHLLPASQLSMVTISDKGI